MNKKILIGICVFYLAATGCGSKSENSNQKNSIENKKLSYHGFEAGNVFYPWDSNSLKFRTSPIGGEGPAPIHGWCGNETPDIKCQKGSKSFEFLGPESLLSITICEDIHKEPKLYTKVLDQAEKSELISILSGIQSIVKKLSGQTVVSGCPVGRQLWLSVNQKDGTIRTLEGEEIEETGEESNKYLKGTLPDLSFLKRFEEIMFPTQN